MYDEAKLAKQVYLKSKVGNGSEFAVPFDEYTGRNERFFAQYVILFGDRLIGL